KIRDVLRLSANGLSKRKIAASLGLSATAAGDCIRRARAAGVAWPLAAGVAWPLAAELADAALEQLLYRSATPVEKLRPQPEWATVHRELKRAGGIVPARPYRPKDKSKVEATVALQWLPCQLGFQRVWLRGNLAEAQTLDRIAMATSAIACKRARLFRFSRH
ncbi:MAG: hypothetical protein J2P54_08500, partial [Bradyrhizobiaceae bacterium]|nr:hypothetical protein [Bradyrhizobiaceae bacterium]